MIKVRHARAIVASSVRMWLLFRSGTPHAQGVPPIPPIPPYWTEEPPQPCGVEHIAGTHR